MLILVGRSGFRISCPYRSLVIEAVADACDEGAVAKDLIRITLIVSFRN